MTEMKDDGNGQQNTDAPKEPVTLEHIHADLHEIRKGGVLNFVFGFCISVVTIGIALLIKSRSPEDIDIWLWALTMGIGVGTMLIVILSQTCCKKSK